MSGDDKTVFVNFEKETPEGYTLDPECIPTGFKTEADKARDALEEAYMELGKAYYEGGFEDPLPQLLPLFDKITRLKNPPKAADNFCPQCGKKLEKNVRFCANCGYRVI